MEGWRDPDKEENKEKMNDGKRAGGDETVERR